jgi:hypothetical protein
MPQSKLYVQNARFEWPRFKNGGLGQGLGAVFATIRIEGSNSKKMSSFGFFK